MVALSLETYNPETHRNVVRILGDHPLANPDRQPYHDGPTAARALINHALGQLTGRATAAGYFSQLRRLADAGSEEAPETLRRRDIQNALAARLVEMPELLTDDQLLASADMAHAASRLLIPLNRANASKPGSIHAGAEVDENLGRLEAIGTLALKNALGAAADWQQIAVRQILANHPELDSPAHSWGVIALVTSAGRLAEALPSALTLPVEEGVLLSDAVPETLVASKMTELRTAAEKELEGETAIDTRDEEMLRYDAIDAILAERLIGRGNDSFTLKITDAERLKVGQLIMRNAAMDVPAVNTRVPRLPDIVMMSKEEAAVLQHLGNWALRHPVLPARDDMLREFASLRAPAFAVEPAPNSTLIVLGVEPASLNMAAETIGRLGPDEQLLLLGPLDARVATPDGDRTVRDIVTEARRDALAAAGVERAMLEPQPDRDIGGWRLNLPTDADGAFDLGDHPRLSIEDRALAMIANAAQVIVHYEGPDYRSNSDLRRALVDLSERRRALGGLEMSLKVVMQGLIDNADPRLSKQLADAENRKPASVTSDEIAAWLASPAGIATQRDNAEQGGRRDINDVARQGIIAAGIDAARDALLANAPRATTETIARLTRDIATTQADVDQAQRTLDTTETIRARTTRELSVVQATQAFAMGIAANQNLLANTFVLDANAAAGVATIDQNRARNIAAAIRGGNHTDRTTLQSLYDNPGGLRTTVIAASNTLRRSDALDRRIMTIIDGLTNDDMLVLPGASTSYGQARVIKDIVDHLRNDGVNVVTAYAWRLRRERVRDEVTHRYQPGRTETMLSFGFDVRRSDDGGSYVTPRIPTRASHGGTVVIVEGAGTMNAHDYERISDALSRITDPRILDTIAGPNGISYPQMAALTAALGNAGLRLKPPEAAKPSLATAMMEEALIINASRVYLLTDNKTDFHLARLAQQALVTDKLAGTFDAAGNPQTRTVTHQLTRALTLRPTDYASLVSKEQAAIELGSTEGRLLLARLPKLTDADRQTILRSCRTVDDLAKAVDPRPRYRAPAAGETTPQRVAPAVVLPPDITRKLAEPGLIPATLASAILDTGVARGRAVSAPGMDGHPAGIATPLAIRGAFAPDLRPQLALVVGGKTLSAAARAALLETAQNAAATGIGLVLPVRNAASLEAAATLLGMGDKRPILTIVTPAATNASEADREHELSAADADRREPAFRDYNSRVDKLLETVARATSAAVSDVTVIQPLAVIADRAGGEVGAAFGALNRTADLDVAAAIANAAVLVSGSRRDSELALLKTVIDTGRQVAVAIPQSVRLQKDDLADYSLHARLIHKAGRMTFDSHQRQETFRAYSEPETTPPVELQQHMTGFKRDEVRRDAQERDSIAQRGTGSASATERRTVTMEWARPLANVTSPEKFASLIDAIANPQARSYVVDAQMRIDRARMNDLKFIEPANALARAERIGALDNTRPEAEPANSKGTFALVFEEIAEQFASAIREDTLRHASQEVSRDRDARIAQMVL